VDLWTAPRGPAHNSTKRDNSKTGYGCILKPTQNSKEALKFDYLIRFRGNIKVTAADGETRAAVDRVGKGGRMRILRGAAVTAEDYAVGAVVCVQAKDMKQAWCLATSLGDENARAHPELGQYVQRRHLAWHVWSVSRDERNPNCTTPPERCSRWHSPPRPRTTSPPLLSSHWR
jgi:hypothetical protein